MRLTRLLQSATSKIPKARRTVGAPPGTMVYTGERVMDEVHVHLTHYDAGAFETFTTQDAIPSEKAAGGKVAWYDMRGLHNTKLVESLGTTYGMHPLALEDVVDIQQRPKMESYEEGVLLQLKAFSYFREKRELHVEQVSVYLAENTVITFQEDGGDLFASVRNRLKNASGRIRSRPADYLAYALVDNIIDNYFVALDQIEESLDELEASIMQEPKMETKALIHNLKLALLTMRKSSSPLREMINRFGDSEHRLIGEDTQLFVRDLKDHVIQVTDLVETYRDVTNGLYDLYVSEISFRMNSVMQTLTIVSTIFIPLSFLAGVYGMNFEYIPELRQSNGYFILWAVMLTIIGLMLWWFRTKRWL